MTYVGISSNHFKILFGVVVDESENEIMFMLVLYSHEK